MIEWTKIKIFYMFHWGLRRYVFVKTGVKNRRRGGKNFKIVCSLWGGQETGGASRRKGKKWKGGDTFAIVRGEE